VRNVDTMAAALPMTGLTELQDLSTGYAAGVGCDLGGCSPRAVSLADGAATTVDTDRPLAVDGSTLAFITSDGLPAIKALPEYADAPRLLSAHFSPAILDSLYGPRGQIQFAASQVLTSCAVEIHDSSGALVRRLPCTAAHGAASVQWDAKNTAGSPVSSGIYSWHLVGANGGSALVDYDGSTDASGTITVAGHPVVSGQLPAPNAVRVAQNANISVTFNEPVVGLNSANLQLATWSAPTVVPAVLTYNAATHAAVIDPKAALAPNTTYMVHVNQVATGLIRGQYGNDVPAAEWWFTTDPGPAIAARGPGGVGVSRNANVVVRFAEPVQGLLPTSFMLLNPRGQAVLARISWNATTRTATLDPVSTLTANQLWTIRMIGGPAGIRDMANNSMPNLQWTFATGTR
jgi:hypothetical protein